MENVLSAPPGTAAPSDLASELAEAQHREAAAQRAFSTSILVSAVRCLLTYVVLPFVAPALGIASDVGPGLGLVIGAVALGSNVLTIRRFHASQHRWRWPVTAISLGVMALLVVLMVEDVVDLVG
ncbi:MAG TPA: hypothetical protein VIL36_24240 [Acidimicrobiales bacterium]